MHLSPLVNLCPPLPLPSEIRGRKEPYHAGRTPFSFFKSALTCKEPITIGNTLPSDSHRVSGRWAEWVLLLEMTNLRPTFLSRALRGFEAGPESEAGPQREASCRDVRRRQGRAAGSGVKTPQPSELVHEEELCIRRGSGRSGSFSDTELVMLLLLFKTFKGPPGPAG